MPNDNQNNNQDDSQPVSTTTPPIVVSEDVLPPMENSQIPPTTENLNTENIETQSANDIVNPSPSSDAQTTFGSASPTEDIKPSATQEVTTTSSPQKKFAGGRVIATILGLLLLVGGVGSGVFLVQQNQDIRERAAAAGECACSDNAGNAVPGECRPDNSCFCPSGTSQRNNRCAERSSAPEDQPNETFCSAQNDIWCNGVDATGRSYGFCIERASDRGCNSYLVERGYTINIGGGSYEGTGQNVTYLCPLDYNQDNIQDLSCDTSTGGQIRNDLSATSCFCGVLQVDRADGTFSSYRSTCGCGGTQTTPPSQTASCQNVRAYSESWTLLTSANLTTLEVGDDVNFCVTGAASAGNFNKARFTINSVLQAETTTKRPGSNDFCQLYTVPSGVQTFNVTAQINHETLGWK